MSENLFIKDIEEVRRINRRIDEINEEAKRYTNGSKGVLEAMIQNIRGNGVNESLNSLKDALDYNCTQISNTVEELHKFIDQQMIKYSGASDTVNLGLTSAQEMIDAIKVGGAD